MTLNHVTMLEPSMPEETVPRPSARMACDPQQEKQFATMLVLHFPRAWRVARRLGLEPAQAEEAAQEAFIVLLQKLDEIEPGKELAFLLSAVAHVCRNMRRKASFTRELAVDPGQFDCQATPVTIEGLVEQKHARELVDEILARMSEPLRVVFVLYELEQLTLLEISEALEIPQGTAGSRLRLARNAFRKELSRLDRHSSTIEDTP